MDTKKKFTELIQKTSPIAFRKTESLTSEKAVDGCGPIIITDANEAGYDLRLLEDKGLLPPNHPVRLACSLTPVKAPEKLEAIEDLKKETGLAFAALVKGKIGSRCGLYRHSNRLFHLKGPIKNTLFAYLEENVTLVLAASEDEFKEFNENKLVPWDGFFAAYFDFAHHVLVNKGKGRISDIEEVVKSVQHPAWQVTGCQVFIPGQIDKSRFWLQGLLINDNNLTESGATLMMPVSVLNEQLIEIINKIKKATE